MVHRAAAFQATERRQRNGTRRNAHAAQADPPPWHVLTCTCCSQPPCLPLPPPLFPIPTCRWYGPPARPPHPPHKHPLPTLLLSATHAHGSWPTLLSYAAPAVFLRSTKHLGQQSTAHHCVVRVHALLKHTTPGHGASPHTPLLTHSPPVPPHCLYRMTTPAPMSPGLTNSPRLPIVRPPRLAPWPVGPMPIPPSCRGKLPRPMTPALTGV